MANHVSRHRRHLTAYRLFLLLTPPRHRARHGREQLQLFEDLVATGSSPLGLWTEAALDLFAVYRSTPPREATGHIARLALYPLSLINITAALTLAVFAATTTAVPAWVAIPASAVLAQGSSGLWWLRATTNRSWRVGTIAFTATEAGAIAVAITGLCYALARQWGSPQPDFGPPTMMTLVGLHGIVGLLATTLHTPPVLTARPRT